MENLGRRERKKQEARDNIKREATILLIKKGADNTRIQEIAEQADISEKTFYNYFQSKNSLLAELADDMLDNSCQMIEHQCQLYPDVRSRIIASFGAAANHMTEFPRLTRDLVQAIFMNYRFDENDDSDPAKNVVRDAFVSIIEEGQKQGAVRDDYPVIFLANMIFGVMNSVIVSWLNSAEGFPLDQEMHRAAEFVVESITVG